MSHDLNVLDDPRGWFGYLSQTLDISPLYTQLKAGLQTDAEVQELFSLIDKDQPNLILFFSAINFLVLGHPQDPLAAFYPYLNEHPRPAEEAYPFFRTFCLSHADELRQILPGSRLQTNEVTRCANLLPAFELVSRYGGRKPLALIEIGASAGLNLNWDRYRYIYDETYAIGDADSPVQIRCTLQGEALPPLPLEMPKVAQRVGIELLPLDVANERDRRWLRACIWPEESWRYRLLDAAIRMAQQYPPHLLAGEACELLPDLLTAVPFEYTLCLWHSFALNNGPVEIRQRVERILVEHSYSRPIYQISLELYPSRPDIPFARLEIYTYDKGLVRSEWLAICALHGERMEWHTTSPSRER